MIMNRTTNTHGIIIGRQPNNNSERYEMIFTNIFTRQCETSIAFLTRRLRLIIALIIIIIIKKHINTLTYIKIIKEKKEKKQRTQ